MTTKADFRAIDTPWGVQHLHKSNLVWYAHYPNAERIVGSMWERNPKKVKGVWIAYHGVTDGNNEKPWCQNNWAISKMDMFTEEEVIKACDEHLMHVDSLRNPL